MSRVTNNLDDGIRVTTDIERSLANNQADTYIRPIKPELNQAKEEYAPVQQNYCQQYKQGNKKKKYKEIKISSREQRSNNRSRGGENYAGERSYSST